jgi:hypothetical protein
MGRMSGSVEIPSRSGPGGGQREYTAHTPDETVWVRVAGSGQVLGVQLEQAVMERRGHEIAERIQACADVAYFEGQVALRTELEQGVIAQYALSWMATREDLVKAQARLRNL